MKIRYVSFAKNYKILTSIISQRKLVKNLSPQEQTAKIAAKESLCVQGPTATSN